MKSIQNRQAVIFARVASIEQADRKQGITAQVDTCLAFARKNDIVVEEVFSTVGKSGESTKEELLKYVRRNKIKCVLVAGLDRLARHQKDFWSLSLALEALDTRLIDTRFATLEVDNELILCVLVALAEYDHQFRSERIKQGLAKSKECLNCGSKISNGLLHRSELRATI